MPFKFVIYPTPIEASTTLESDDGFTGNGQPYSDPAIGRPGQLIVIPDTITSGHGSTLTIEAPDFNPLRLRGFLMLADNIARFQADDFVLTEKVEVPEPPPVLDPNLNPADVINYVFNSGRYNLNTKEGCGRFTEDCCTELHNTMHNGWGHIRKDPGQNQYNGHAVDAIVLLVSSGGTGPGTYDIIYSTESPDAHPAFNYAGPADPEKWYYPAAPITPNTLAVSKQMSDPKTASRLQSQTQVNPGLPKR